MRGDRCRDRAALRSASAADRGAGGRRAAIAPLSVDGAAGWTARGPRWLATSTPEFVLQARVEALLAEEDGGELDVTASAALDSDDAGEPELAVEVLAERRGRRWRAGRFNGSRRRLRASFVLARRRSGGDRGALQRLGARR
jgi:hypothetical protein